MVATLPFRARRRFRLDGREIEAGEVIDAAGLTPTRVRQLEAANYGMRVAAEQPDHEPGLPAGREQVSPAPDTLPSPPAGEPLVASELGAEGSEEQGEEEGRESFEELEGSDDDAFLEIEAPAPAPSTAASAPRASARSSKARTSPPASKARGARKRS